MENKNIAPAPISDPYLEEVKTKSTFSFDFVLWFYRILKHWYLFAITVPIFLTIAYFENKSWIPSYFVKAELMLEAKGNSVITNAVPLGNILRNAQNQSLLLRSYSMVNRTVSSLPRKMFVDYYRTDRFKTLNLYSSKPVAIDTVVHLEDAAYKYRYNIAPVDDDHCRIYILPDEKTGKGGFELIAKYGKVVEANDKRFKIKLSKTDAYEEGFVPYSFAFLREGNLVSMFFGRIGASPSKDSNMMDVTMGGAVPDRDVDFLRVHLDEFLSYGLELKNEQADKTISFINRQLTIIEDSLALSIKTLKWFQDFTGVYEVTSPSLRGEMEKADLERDNLAVLERSLLTFTKTITDNIMKGQEIVLPLGFANVSNIGELKQYVQNYNELITTYRNLGSKNPIYEKKIDEVNEARKEILTYLQVQQNELQYKKDELIKKYELLDLKIQNLPSQERDLVAFQRKYKTYEMYEQFLNQKKQEALIQKESNIADNDILEEPRQMGGPNNGAIKEQRYMSHLMFALILPLIFIVLKEEVLNFTISTKEEVERLSGLPVIGTIENVADKMSKGKKAVLVRNFPKSSFAESFRNIRVRLEYLAQRESKISILITSAEPADGKTFIATNIASVYQLMGKRVAIIDLDLRRPSVASTLNVKASKGVSNYLIGQVTLEDITISHPDYGFDIIPSGTLPPNPSELIKTEKTKELLKILKEKYDYIVIDCSPVGLVSDAYILSRMMDVTLFAVRRGKTNKSFFKSVITQLRHDGIENAAIVFNDVKGREGYYGTSRYYGNKTYYLKQNSYYHDDFYEE